MAAADAGACCGSSSTTNSVSCRNSVTCVHVRAHTQINFMVAGSGVRGVLSTGQEVSAGLRTASERESSGCCSSRACIRDTTGQPSEGASPRGGRSGRPAITLGCVKASVHATRGRLNRCMEPMRA